MDGLLKYWLALCRIKGVTGALLKELSASNSSPETLFKGKAPEGLAPDTRDSIRAFNDWGWVEDELALVKKHGARVIPFSDELYPPLLREIDDPPSVLYAKGDAAGLGKMPAVAVVGTRHPTHYGRAMASVISAGIALAGAAVVSGMARGCDMEAHKGALEAKGFTAAVLGTGIDVVYPRENRKLYEEICREGVALSELPMGTGPRPYNFPLRNRIISGVSRGVVVIEAPARSGALMTASISLDYNREVMAVPGPANSSRSRGANRLIKDGATLVECAGDVLDALSIPRAEAEKDTEKKKTKEIGGEEGLVLKVLRNEPLHIDDITEKTGLSIVKASALLMEMEIKGFVRQMPGKCFLRTV